MAIFDEKIEIRERCKGVHCVDLGESFPTSIYLQKSTSIQPRTSLSKFGGKFNSLFIRLRRRGSATPAGGSAGRARSTARWSAPASKASITTAFSSTIRLAAKLKGSIGEGPNHSNFSDRSAVRILGIQRKPRKAPSRKKPLQRSGPNSFKIQEFSVIFGRKFKISENFNIF